jgi:hypothetical protein
VVFKEGVCFLACVLQVIVGNMPWRFSSYMAYCDNGAAQDEMPLYLFDKVRCSSSRMQFSYCQPF